MKSGTVPAKLGHVVNLPQLSPPYSVPPLNLTLFVTTDYLNQVSVGGLNTPGDLDS